ncbi:MAG: LysR family transcriptional regulator [Pseudomonadota bacterium]
MSLTLKQLETFVAVADLGGFSRAADRLSTTQPNVSARIASLEGALGGALFVRDSGQPRLTELGERTLASARDVLAARDTLIDVAASPRLYEGSIRLGVTEVIAATWLSDLLVALRNQIPNVLVELTVGLSLELTQALQARELDLALQNGPFREHFSGELALGSCSMVWVAPPERELPSGDLDHVALRNHPILTHTRGSRPHQQLTEYFATKAGARPRIVPSSNLSVCIELLIKGYGIACLPAPMAAPHLAAGAIVPIACQWTPDDLSFFARFDRETAPGYVAIAAELAAEVADAHRAKS